MNLTLHKSHPRGTDDFEGAKVAELKESWKEAKAWHCVTGLESQRRGQEMPHVYLGMP